MERIKSQMFHNTGIIRASWRGNSPTKKGAATGKKLLITLLGEAEIAQFIEASRTPFFEKQYFCGHFQRYRDRYFLQKQLENYDFCRGTNEFSVKYGI